MENKNRNIKSILIILTLIMAMFTIYQIANTYAIFHSELQGTVSQSLGKWNIKINDLDITNGIAEEYIINSFILEQNDRVKEGKFAPSSEGKFEINILPQDTQVSIKYDISIDLQSLEDYSINLISVNKTTSGNSLVQTGENTYTGVIPVSSINGTYKDTIEIRFKWENIEANNPKDTVIGTRRNSKFQIPITIDLIQYMGEPIMQAY